MLRRAVALSTTLPVASDRPTCSGRPGQSLPAIRVLLGECGREFGLQSCWMYMASSLFSSATSRPVFAPPSKLSRASIRLASARMPR